MIIFVTACQHKKFTDLSIYRKNDRKVLSYNSPTLDVFYCDFLYII